MKHIKDNNKGFTMLELVVSIAVLAILMTSVCGLMVYNTVTYKKTKADIVVQGSAQQTYDQIYDSIMQAKEIKITGYTTGDDITFDVMNPGALVPASMSKDTYVKTPASGEKAFTALRVEDASLATDMVTYTQIYLDTLEIKYSVPLDLTNCSVTKVSAYPNGDVILSDGRTVNLYEPDVCTVTYVFEKNNIYVKRTYEIMDKLNQTYTAASPAVQKENCLYATSLNYVKCGTDYISGAIATVDAETGNIGIDLKFADKNMSYNTKGMITIKNSYVLKEAN